MKNQAILVSHKNEEALVINSSEALSFVRSLGTSVEGYMLEVFTDNFNLFLNGKELNSNGGNTKTFAIGGNSNNPLVYFRNVTGLHANKDLKKVANQIVEKSLENNKNTDLSLNVTILENGYKITGGTNWYWSQLDNRHYAINQVILKSDSLDVDKQLSEIKAMING